MACRRVIEESVVRDRLGDWLSGTGLDEGWLSDYIKNHRRRTVSPNQAPVVPARCARTDD